MAINQTDYINMKKREILSEEISKIKYKEISKT